MTGPPLGSALSRRPLLTAILTFAATVLIVRWQTGPGFGYTIAMLSWTPLAAVCLPAIRTVGWGIGACAALTLLAALPWWFAEPVPDVARLSLLLLAWTISAWSIRRLLNVILRPLFSPKHGSKLLIENDLSPSTGLAAVLWLTWLTLPLTRADGLSGWLGEPWFGRLLSQHPLLAANAFSSSAGDWTHAAIAYRFLTVLGQDVPIDWPGSVFGSLIGCGLIIGLVTAAGLAIRQLRRCKT